MDSRLAARSATGLTHWARRTDAGLRAVCNPRTPLKDADRLVRVSCPRCMGKAAAK